MTVSENAKANTVSANGQLPDSEFVSFEHKENAKLRVVIVGNSITRHGPAEHIGWHGNWGMAASSKDNDFVHRTLYGLEQIYGDVSLCISQAATWERRYDEGEPLLEQYFANAREFAADLVIIRIGENVDRSKHAQIPIQPYYEQMVRYFASNPNAKVICTDNFWNISVLNDAFKEVAHKNGWCYCRIGDLEHDERTMAKGQFEHAGVAAHPSDYGMQRIADRLIGSACALLGV